MSSLLPIPNYMYSEITDKTWLELLNKLGVFV